MPYKDLTKRREYHNQYIKDNPEKRTPYDPIKQREYTKRSTLNNVNSYLLRIARHRAKKRNIEFTITKDDVIVPTHCPILGIELVCGVGSSSRSGGNWNSPSLDRIDNTKGYIKGNVQVISHQANSMKSIASKEQLLMFANYILKQYE